jgi:pyruvate formate lyase activating enzyme
MRRAYEIARKHLRHVYVGNMFLAGTSDTACLECGAVLISRAGYQVDMAGITQEGRCKHCGADTQLLT